MTRRIYAGTRKGLFAIDRTNSGWEITQATLLGDPISMLLPQAEGSVTVAQDLGHFGVKVKRSTDGGHTFEKLTDGLPQEHAYDLVYRHGLDMDSSGDVIAFGSTTGNLFVSEDQGDHWQCISHTLPPVYCVRFAP